MDQLVIEGFSEKWFRRKANDLGRNIDTGMHALKLAEECLKGAGIELDRTYRLMTPFHDVHNARSLLKGHALGSEAAAIKKQALQEFGNYRHHFEHLCTVLDESLEVLIDVFTKI